MQANKQITKKNPQLTQSGVADGQREGSNVADTAQEARAQLLVGVVQHLGLEDGASVVHHQRQQTVREGRDGKHVQQGGLRGTDTLTGLDDVDVVQDLNRTLVDLGGDVEGLEERGFLGTHGGGAGIDPHVVGGKRARLGGGLDLELLDLGLDVREVALGEDKADVATDVVQQVLQGGELVNQAANALADHRVLTHDDLATATEGQAVCCCLWVCVCGCVCVLVVE